MTPEWDRVDEARIRAPDLECLAALRTRPDIRVRLVDGVVWVSWSSSRAEVIQALLPRPGVEFFQSARSVRHRFGSLLPTADAPPEIEASPLASVLFPTAPQPVPPGVTSFGEWPLRLVRSDVARPTAALLCEVAALRTFADTATTAELAGVSGLLSGDRAVLFGEKLPIVLGAVRFHGRDVLVPIGFCLEPDLPGAAIRSAVDVPANELLLITESGFEVIPQNRAEPLTRAGLRLAIAGATP